MTVEPAPDDDPILERRDRYRTGAAIAQRIGYLLYGAATILFFAGLLTSFSGIIVTIIIVFLIAASVILAVAIQVSYAIRGAERHEEDATAQRRRR